MKILNLRSKSYPKKQDNNNSVMTEEKCEPKQKKCGEILINEFENFSFCCILCGIIKENIEIFIEHIKVNHIELYKPKDLLKTSKTSKSSKKSAKVRINVPSIEFVSSGCIEIKHELNSLSPPRPPQNKDTQFESFAVDYSVKKEDEECHSEQQTSEEQIKANDTTKESKTQDSKKIYRVEDKVQQMENKDAIDPCPSRSKIKTKDKPGRSDRTTRSRKMNTLCDICNRKFQSEKILQSHLKYDHAPTNSFIQETTIEEVPLSDPLKCRYCERKFSTRKSRYQHECLHTGERPYKCDVCSKRYCTLIAYKTHIEIHKNDRPFKCEICPVGFNSLSNLMVHIRRHKNERIYKCRYCNKGFVTSSTKRIHERIHTGEKPYQCTQCGICFISASALNAHVICHAIDKPFKCQYCERPFSAKREKDEHERIHTGEKPHTCEICNASFRTGRALRNHKKTHSK